MTSRLAPLALLVPLSVLPVAASAADQLPAGETDGAKPMFLALPQRPVPERATRTGLAAAHLPQWNGGFTDLTGKHITYTMIGTNPATTNITTSIPVYMIPIKMVYGPANGNMTFNPVVQKEVNGLTVAQNLNTSPLFNASLDFVEGGTNLGKVEYIDGFQRGNFWSSVETNTAYHTRLDHPVWLTTQTIVVPAADGKVIANPFVSGKVGTMTVSSFDAQLQKFMKSFAQINPGVLPIFVTYDIYLTSGGCCIGGYHSAVGGQPGGQTYAYATYADPGAFAQDVGALSHELGEWMDDPFVDNVVNCSSDANVLEVGDPLEGDANYGDYAYAVGGFTYHLQSLVYLNYFGAPRNGPVHSWLSFQNDESEVCPGQ
jgi:hypothetical protein